MVTWDIRREVTIALWSVIKIWVLGVGVKKNKKQKPQNRVIFKRSILEETLKDCRYNWKAVEKHHTCVRTEQRLRVLTLLAYTCVCMFILDQPLKECVCDLQYHSCDMRMTGDFLGINLSPQTHTRLEPTVWSSLPPLLNNEDPPQHTHTHARALPTPLQISS